MNRNESYGFTLIETLVAINLMFIVFTFSISIYLFVNKYTESVTRNITEIQNVNTVFYYIHKSLNQADNFIVNISKDKVAINTDTEDSISITKNEIKLNEYFHISSIDNLSIKLNSSANETTDLNINKISFPVMLVFSRDIISISFSFTIKGKPFDHEVFIYNNSLRRFKNKNSFSDISITTNSQNR